MGVRGHIFKLGINCLTGSPSQTPQSWMLKPLIANLHQALWLMVSPFCYLSQSVKYLLQDGQLKLSKHCFAQTFLPKKLERYQYTYLS